MCIRDRYKITINSVCPSAAQNKNRSFHVITYMGKITEKVVQFFKKYDLKFAFKTSKTFQSLIKNNKSKTKDKDKSGVYSKQCGSENCNCIYIGQTGRSFESRNDEHIKAYRNNHPEKSNIAYHVLNNNHEFDINFKI